MSNFISKAKAKALGDHAEAERNKSTSQEGEQTFSIQPHPAKTNDPNDLNREGPAGAGFGSDSANMNFGPGPVLPNAQEQQQLPPPASRDELRARSAALNNDQ